MQFSVSFWKEICKKEAVSVRGLSKETVWENGFIRKLQYAGVKGWEAVWYWKERACLAESLSVSYRYMGKKIMR